MEEAKEKEKRGEEERGDLPAELYQGGRGDHHRQAQRHPQGCQAARHQALQHSPEGGALRHEAAPPDCEDGCHRPLPAVREKKPVQMR